MVGIERGAVVDAQGDWFGVRERVIALVEARHRKLGWPPPQYSIFETVLTADEIAEVEAQSGVALPDEYRSFLAEVGAGGPGPELNLTSLCRIEGRWGWVWDAAGPEEAWHLNASGPFVESEQWADHQVETLRAAGYEPPERDGGESYLDDYLSVFGDVGEGLWRWRRGCGAIHISDDGCGMTNWLIVVGPHRGELRDRDCGRNPPYDPLTDACGNRHTFRTWYLDWLERREAKLTAGQQRL